MERAITIERNAHEEVQAGASRRLARDYLYDGLGRLSRARHFNLGLDFTGSPVPSAERLATTSLTYDSLGRVATETTQVGTRPARTTASAWSLQAGNAQWRRTVTRPGGAASVEDFDGFGRLTSLSRPGTTRTTEWAWLGELPTAQDSAKPGSPLRRSWTHDAFGQARAWAYSAVDVDTSGTPVVAAEGAAVCPGGWNATCARPVLSASVLRDKAGRILSHARTVARPDEAPWTGWKGYSFDGLGRLTRAWEGGTLPDTTGVPKSEATAADIAALGSQVRAQRWDYAREAAVGSVLAITGNAIDFGTHVQPAPAPRFQAPARGPGHQLTQYTLDDSVTRAVTHDGAGRLASNGQATYRWDDFDALVAVEVDSGVQEALQHDGLGRLVARHNRNRLEEELAWDGAQLVAAYDSSGAATWTATWGPGVDNLVSVAQGGAEYLALSDGKGSVAGYYRAEDNRLVAAADYTPEGRAAVVDYEAGTTCVESGATRCGRLGGLPFGFHSAYQSPATGLLYFRNRWYSPEAAQWLSQDALGFVDSFSLYAFNGFDAVNFRDPWGTKNTHFAEVSSETTVDCQMVGGQQFCATTTVTVEVAGPTKKPEAQPQALTIAQQGWEFCQQTGIGCPTSARANMPSKGGGGEPLECATCNKKPRPQPQPPAGPPEEAKGGIVSLMRGLLRGMRPGEGGGSRSLNPLKRHWESAVHENSADVLALLKREAARLAEGRAPQAGAAVRLLALAHGAAKDVRALGLALYQYGAASTQTFYYPKKDVPTGFHPALQDPNGSDQVHHALAAVGVRLLMGPGSSDAAQAIGFAHEVNSPDPGGRFAWEDVALNAAGANIGTAIESGAFTEQVIQVAKTEWCASASCGVP